MDILAVGENAIFTLDKAMLAPIQDAITTNLVVLLPVGVFIMGTMIAVSLIPRVVYKFL